jgi:ketosteroid isomerase-like protein
MRSIVAVALLLVALSGRAAAQQGNQPAAPALPSVTLPADLARVLRDYERAWRASDVEALVALFTDDGFVLQPSRPPARGHAALAERYAGQGGGPLTLRALAYATADTVGYIIGAYGYDEGATDLGKFTLTLRRGPSGRWLIASDMDNGNAPPRRAPPPPSNRS